MIRIKTSQLNLGSPARTAQTGRCICLHCLLAMTTHVAGKVFVLWPAKTTAHLSLSLCLSSQSQSHWGFCFKCWCQIFYIAPGRHSACKLPELSSVCSLLSSPFLYSFLFHCPLNSFSVSHSPPPHFHPVQFLQPANFSNCNFWGRWGAVWFPLL